MLIFSCLIFIAINLISLFIIKGRSAMIIALTMSHLALIFFCCLAISNEKILQEIILAIIFYLLILLFLIINYDSLKKLHKPLTIAASSHVKFFTIFAFCMIFFCQLYLTNDILHFAKSAKHLESKEQILVDEKVAKLAMSKNQNHALKYSSNIILLIAFAINCGALLAFKKKNKIS